MSETGQQPSDVSAPATGSPQKTERTLGMLCHLLAFCGFTCIPFANIIGPLVLWLIKKDDSAFVNDQGKESVNFQITVTLGFVICLCLMPVGGIGGVLALVLMIVNVVFIIIAMIKANGGEMYRYPFAIRLVK